ncbi:cyclic lactone autoinducer peptide [Paenibacillus filicis]|uniref:Cyclic lactone autoinducer peptide n=1 Tax=Paenibacillus filicis TaxID=669464 RepID=A0ABU9DXV4_9BACL
MKKIVSFMAMPLVATFAFVLAVVQPACFGIWFEPEAPKE